MIWQYNENAIYIYIIQFYFRSTLVYTVYIYIYTRLISLQYDRLQKNASTFAYHADLFGKYHFTVSTSYDLPVTCPAYGHHRWRFTTWKERLVGHDLNWNVFWKSTSQLVTKLWIDMNRSYLFILSQQKVSFSGSLYTPHQNPPNSWGRVHRRIWFQRPRPWVPKMVFQNSFQGDASRCPHIGIYAQSSVHACWCSFRMHFKKTHRLEWYPRVIPMYTQCIYIIYIYI